MGIEQVFCTTERLDGPQINGQTQSYALHEIPRPIESANANVTTEAQNDVIPAVDDSAERNTKAIKATMIGTGVGLTVGIVLGIITQQPAALIATLFGALIGRAAGDGWCSGEGNNAIVNTPTIVANATVNRQGDESASAQVNHAQVVGNY